jgi:3-oxoacyl-[acyl-carrier protein] reductase
MVRCFAGAGYGVGVHYFRNRESAEAAVRDAHAAGVGARAYQADACDPGAVRAMAAQMAAEMGEVTYLVCNAGYGQQKLFTDISGEEWEHMFAVHVHGAFHACQAVLPAMIHRKRGSIVLVSSMWGQSGASCEVHYSAAKAALEGMAKALAKELGPSGIRVNGIAPGVIDTGMNKALGEDALRTLADETALGRLGLPDEVAALAVFLSGSEAAYITGQIVGVNGGYLMQ